MGVLPTLATTTLCCGLKGGGRALSTKAAATGSLFRGPAVPVLGKARSFSVAA